MVLWLFELVTLLWIQMLCCANDTLNPFARWHAVAEQSIDLDDHRSFAENLL